MTKELDPHALVLIEEHVRRLLEVMGFTTAKVHCRVRQAALATSLEPAPTEDDALFNNAALNSPTRRNLPTRERQRSVELQLDIEVGEPGKVLIGNHGVHLDALQHLLRAVLRRQLATAVYVVVDINGYRARREQNLLQLAESTARQARQSGRTVTLKPMNAADRRVIHAALATRTDVRTESMGEEPDRRVVVRPVF